MIFDVKGAQLHRIKIRDKWIYYRVKDSGHPFNFGMIKEMDDVIIRMMDASEDIEIYATNEIEFYADV